MTLGREDVRQAIHLGVSLVIVVLPWLTRGEALLVAAAAVVLNWVILPVSGIERRWFGRESGGGDDAQGAGGRRWRLDGVRWYPVAVLGVIAACPLPVAAAAWAVLGWGDSCSNVVGRRLGRPPFAGRQDRSLAGSIAFVAVAAPAAMAAYWWVARTHEPQLDTLPLVLAGIAAAVAGALAELVPLPRWLDDNLPITACAAAACWGVVLASA